MENYLYYSLYQMVLKSLTFYLGVEQEKKKAGRPLFTLAKSLIDPNIKSYHLF